MRIKNRLLLLLFVLFTTHFAGFGQEMEPQQFHALFDRYVGVWRGEYRIFSSKDELISQFKVNRNYWWADNVLMGRISYDFGDDSQTYFHRIILSNGMPFAFVTDRPDSGKIMSALKGEELQKTVIWKRVLPKEGLPVRISERLVSRDGETFLEFWGDQEVKNSSGSSRLVRIDGFLSFLPDSRDFVVASEQPESVNQELLEQVELTDPTIETPDLPVEDLPQSEASLEEPKMDPVIERKIEPEVEKEEKPKDRSSKKKERKAKPQPVVKEPVADPEIESYVSKMNIVGIDAKGPESLIVVDYFQLYRIGARVDFEKPLFFTAVDANYLYFEDSNGFTYRRFRDDVMMD
ncbi:MAG: hypothetical protein MI748_12315 [Opitutales bacterium]|nr:hypothetical protein [Opitutales bacterium]